VTFGMGFSRHSWEFPGLYSYLTLNIGI
jgi:hypothetical protein